MKGGGKPTILEEWVRLANLETDTRSRANYAALALIFAGLTRHLALWKKTLEGWNMRESIIINEWKAEALAEGRAEGEAKGEAKAAREILLYLLRDQFPGEIPANLVAAIEGESDQAKLRKAILLSQKTASIEEFCAESGL
jgi:hypothetical protein